MSLQDIAALGKLLAQFLSLFADCFRRPAGRLLLAVYVRGLLSNVQRKNVEALALAGTLRVERWSVIVQLPGETESGFSPGSNLTRDICSRRCANAVRAASANAIRAASGNAVRAAGGNAAGPQEATAFWGRSFQFIGHPSDPLKIHLSIFMDANNLPLRTLPADEPIVLQQPRLGVKF